MLACGLVRTSRVADTRRKRLIFDTRETGQKIGRSRPRVATVRRWVGAAAILGCFGAVSACRSEAPPTPDVDFAPAPARGGELVASIRSEPPTYNRFVAAGAVAATDVVTFLTQARLVRVNRATDELEPWLAEGWTSSPDGLTHTPHAQAGPPVLGRRPPDRRRRAVLVPCGLRSRGCEPSRLGPVRTRQAARGLGAGRPHRRHSVPRSLPGWSSAARQPADSSEAQARAAAECRSIPARVGGVRRP